MQWTGIQIIGFIGGSTISISLLPQVIKTYTTKSAADISYLYQAVYILGCTLVNTYAITERLWPVFIPCLFEELLIISLTVMKFVYEKCPKTSMSRISEPDEETNPKVEGIHLQPEWMQRKDTLDSEELEEILDQDVEAGVISTP